MVPKAQHAAESNSHSPVGLFQAMGQFASSLNHHCNFLIVHMWSSPWDLLLYGHRQWLLILMITPSCLPFAVLLAKATVASCPGSWMSVEAAVPAKSQNIFERRAEEAASTVGSATQVGTVQRETTTGVKLGCVLERNMWHCRSCAIIKGFVCVKIRKMYGLGIAFKSTPDLAELS